MVFDLNARRNLSAALQALLRHRIRSVLTFAAITVGVAVVITTISVGSGARSAIDRQVRAAGANLITVSAGNYSPGDLDPSSRDVDEPGNNAGDDLVAGAPAQARSSGWAGMGVSPRIAGRGRSKRLSSGDAAAIARIPGVQHALAGVGETAVVAVAGGVRLLGRLEGTEAEFPHVRGLIVQGGRFFSAREVDKRARVAALSRSVSDRLFGETANPVGRVVRIRQADFAIVGVVERPGGLGVGRSALDHVFVPFTTLQDLLGLDHLQSIAVSIAQAGEATSTARAVIVLLRERHGLGPEDPDDFVVRTEARDAISGKGIDPLIARAVAGSVVNLDEITLVEISASLERASRTMTALLVSVAGVSLLVGSIGIMNVMLVSVTERTREIGLRMAVGARGRDVLVQFLAEAVSLSLIGGVGGVAAGMVAAGGLGQLMRWTTVVTPASVAISLLAAGSIGVLFGFYPAQKASRLQPVEALRFE